MDNVAIASYAFHGLHKAERMNLFGYLESSRYRYHLGNADIWNGMMLSTEDDYLAKVKDGLDARDLALVNLCVDGAHIWEEDPELRQRHYKNALAHLYAAEFLGARTVRIDAGGREDVWNDEQFDMIVSRYQEYAQRAYDNGYLVGPENHWGTEVDPDNMVKLCQAVDHPGFGILLHFRNVEDDARMAPWAMHTHIAWTITEGDLVEEMTLLRDAGYGGCWSVEHHTGENEFTEVAIQLAKVKDVLNRWRMASY